jgi:hypothetical protein
MADFNVYKWRREQIALLENENSNEKDIKDEFKDKFKKLTIKSKDKAHNGKSSDIVVKFDNEEADEYETDVKKFFKDKGYTLVEEWDYKSDRRYHLELYFKKK